MTLKRLQFDWDQWNIQKNEIKHGVSTDEAESVFLDADHVVFQDEIHSTKHEVRYIIFGQSLERRVLMVGFTVRKNKIRIITARTASRKERLIYEKT